MAKPRQRAISPTWYKEDATCQVCGDTFRRRDRNHLFCSNRCRGRWKYLTGRNGTKAQYERISGNWDRYLCRLLYRGSRRSDGLTVDVLTGLLERQKGKCALTGVGMTCHMERGKRTLTNASVDRINAGGAYEPGNVQLVCRAVNNLRGDLTLPEFVEWCRKVVENYGEG